MKKLLLATIAVLTGYILRERILTEIRVMYLRHKMRLHEKATRESREHLRPPKMDPSSSRHACPTCREALPYFESRTGGITVGQCSYCFPKLMDERALSKDLSDLYRGEGRILQEMKREPRLSAAERLKLSKMFANEVDGPRTIIDDSPY